MVGTLLFVIFGVDAELWIARPAIAIYLAQHWPSLPLMGRGLLGLTIATALGLLTFHPDPLPILLAGWDSLSFFATFITSLGLLRVAASSSSFALVSGKILLQAQQ